VVGVGVNVQVGVGVGVGVGVIVAEGVAVSDGVGVQVAVSVGWSVAVGLSELQPANCDQATAAAITAAAQPPRNLARVKILLGNRADIC